MERKDTSKRINQSRSTQSMCFAVLTANNLMTSAVARHSNLITAEFFSKVVRCRSIP